MSVDVYSHLSDKPRYVWPDVRSVELTSAKMTLHDVLFANVHKS